MQSATIIEINNCNNIDFGRVQIVPKALNIKYGTNGTGKSTLSKAVVYAATDEAEGSQRLEQLRPFKAAHDNAIVPSVSGVGAFRTVRIFNEAYIDEFVFKADELVKGSFDIFVRDRAYEDGIREIESLVSQTKDLLSKDTEIQLLISDLRELSQSFGRQAKTGIHGGSKLAKAFKGGNKVVNVPQSLEVYTKYLQSESNYKWIKWQLEGQQFLDDEDDCPYCVSDIAETKHVIAEVPEVYNAKSIEHLNKLVEIFGRLSQYFSEGSRRKLDSFIQNVDGYTDGQISYLREVREQADALIRQFEKAQTISFSTLKDLDQVVRGLRLYLIDITDYCHFESAEMVSKVSRINASVEKLISQADALQRKVAIQKQKVDNLVSRHKYAINSFLRNAGYQYEVDLVENESKEHRLVLRPLNLTSEVQQVENCLSHGEKNAFALVLFMFDVLSKDADLIVLDDPISSFDKNKKYAIAQMLFGEVKLHPDGQSHQNFRDETVLLLSHDLEPIVDIVHHHYKLFSKTLAHFLENCRGQVVEKRIKRGDIRTFVDINKSNIRKETCLLSQLIYLRRLYEIMNDRGMGYQLASNIIHRRRTPWIKDSQAPNQQRNMTPQEINEGITAIALEIESFDYAQALELVLNDAKLIELYTCESNNYKKLHLYRILFENRPSEKIDSSPIKKFIDQAFHIETDYIYQLNPAKYQTVPQYVVDECDRLIAELPPS